MVEIRVQDEPDTVRVIKNDMKLAIENNQPIEDVLHVVIVVSNPCQYKRRFTLAKEFMARQEARTQVYVVELAHDDDPFQVTDPENPFHLQIRTRTAPLWHKENLINIGVRTLLPSEWKAFAWIDADVEFESATWALDALKILNGCRDVIQLWSHAIDMDPNEDTMKIFESFGYQYVKEREFGKSLWHPGFAWAMTRRAYEKLGGLYEMSILGAGDHNMALCLIGKGIKSINAKTTKGYKSTILKFEEKARGLRLGYVPGVIRHYFHGKKKNRRYAERWEVLVKNAYDPSIHVKRDPRGLLVPTTKCPPKLLSDIMTYFRQRNEDESSSRPIK